MKRLLIITTLLFALTQSHSQFINPTDSTYRAQFTDGYEYDKYGRWDLQNFKSRKDHKQFNAMSWCMFISGVGRGMEQVLVYHYDDGFAVRHPKANPNFWNPKYSWSNKYKHHIPQAGPKFPFSTTALVWMTDGKHLMDVVNNVPLYVCVSIPIAYPSHKQHSLHDVLGRALTLSVYRQMGFFLAYNIVY